ncbi:MAG TPA: GspH/FimT family pseudopilin [Thermoanaerobaculia bacterium]|nr:GspH/FimT family pseudopilin [Thermoanaerobaculia bacterium]
MRRSEKGQSLIELLVVVSLLGFFGVMGNSALNHARRNVALLAGTSELRSLFQRVRMLAVSHNRNLAIRFRPVGDTWSWSVYEDGDGDGVRNDDITKGIDAQVDRTRLFRFQPVRVGVPAAPVIDPMNGQLLSLRLPVRFGTSQLCSFSRDGEATNGSIVLTDGERATIIRVGGTSALINVIHWDGKKWITTS